MIRNPEYFAAIVKAGSLTKASKLLYVSQPYLSQYLKQLEASLGIELFDHTTSPLTLTYAGELFYQYILREIRQKEDFRNMISDLRQEEVGCLRVGMPSWRASCTLPLVYPEFHNQFPKVDFQLSEAPPARLIDQLLNGSLELAVFNSGSLPTEHIKKELDYDILSEERIILAVPAGHPAVQSYMENKTPQSSPITMLKEIPLINTRTSTSEIFPNSLNQLLREFNITPEILLTTGNFTISMNLVSAGVGCAFTMEGETMVPGRRDNILFFPVQASDYCYSVVAVYRLDAYLSRFARQFIKLSQECFAKARIHD